MPAYGSPHRHGALTAWSMLRPGLRSALPTALRWLPLGPADNPDLAQLIARSEAVDNPPYRTSEVETAEYFADPVYTGVAGRDEQGVMRAFALVRLRPSREIYVSMSGIVDPVYRGQGIGKAIIHWQVESARHLVGTERIGLRQVSGGAPVPAHVVTGVLDDDQSWRDILEDLGFEARRYYREVRRELSREVPDVPLDGFMEIVPWSEELDDVVRRAHNGSFTDTWGAQPMTAEEWTGRRPYFAPQWSFVALDRSGDRARVAGYLVSSRYEQDWDALGWEEGYTDMLGVLAGYRHRGVARALLVEAMRAYRRDGMEYAAAGVDSEDPAGAVDVYEDMGYTPMRGTILYSLDV